MGFMSGTAAVVLKIDTSKVPGLQLYIDPQFPVEDSSEWVSAYSKVPVPPDAISVMSEDVFEDLRLVRKFILEVVKSFKMRVS